MAVRAFARELGDGSSKLLHEDVDTLLDDDIGFEVADALNVNVEVVGLGIVVKGLVGIGSGLPLSIGRDGPGVRNKYNSSSNRRGYIPFTLRVLLVPVVHVPQVVMRVVLEAHSSSGRPFCVLLGGTLLSQAGQLDLLALPKLADQSTLALRVRDDGVSDCVVHPLALNDQIAGIDGHDSATTTRVQRQSHAAAHTGGLAVALACIFQVRVAVLRIERDHTQAVGKHLIGQHGGVAFDLDQIQCDGVDFGEDGSAERVGKGQVDRGQSEIDAVGLRLRGDSQSSAVTAWKNPAGTYFTDCNLRPLGLQVHLVIHSVFAAALVAATRVSVYARLSAGY